MLIAFALADEPSLAAYMDAAVRNNPRSALARAATTTARADVEEAGAALLPTVRGSASWTYNQYEALAWLPDPAGGAPEEIVIVPQQQNAAALTARVPLLDGPGLARWWGLRDGVDAASHDERTAERDLRIDVARAWYAAVAAQEVEDAAERAQAAAEENRRYLAARAEAGAATALSVQRAELEVANAERLAIDGRRGWLTARRALATLSGLPEPESLPTMPADTAAVGPEEDALAAAEANRPELAAARARADQVRLARQATWLGWTPTIAATASERYTNASGFSGEETSWVVGVEADWLLLDFGDRVGEAHRARAALESAEATLRQTRDRVRDEVHAAWLDVDAARAGVAATRRGATVAHATAEEVGVRFRAGTATQLEVIQAERDALDAEVRRIRAEGELSLSRLALQRAAGEPIRP